MPDIQFRLRFCETVPVNNPENLNDIVIRQEIDSDNEAIEALGVEAFGPGRFSRSAFRLREGVLPDRKLSFVASIHEMIVGSVRLTPIIIGKKQALVLGPLMISPDFKSLGIGRELMNRSLLDMGGSALIVSQFTLAGDTSRGNRPGFSAAAAPEQGRALYEHFVNQIKALDIPTAAGVFGADMAVSLINDGPVTLWLDV